ncbi:MAG: low molecular weight protein arginine phosphatase [Clostridia bacterium]|jgi:protein-tyrosine phosphatase|nr:low molecular weight protein arginine phosphatase [Clostridia bacterium]MDD4571047.1 low molecular weight protein arginine phosphatase [Clostridia bacterium]
MYDFTVRPKSMLFICTGNTCRSPMAECLAREIFPDIAISSAGLAGFSGMLASEGAIAAMAARGFSLEAHRSRAVTSYLLEEAELIIPMTSSHKRAVLAHFPEFATKVFTLGELAADETENDNTALAEINDPYGLPTEVYLDTANNIEKLLFALAAKLPVK